MSSAFTCYANNHSTGNNESKQQCDLFLILFKIFESYFSGNDLYFTCREHQSLSPNMQNIIRQSIKQK